MILPLAHVSHDPQVTIKSEYSAIYYMPRQDGRSITDQLLSKLTEYIPVDSGLLEVWLRHVTQQEYIDQHKRHMEAGAHGLG